jgi:prepilin-type processing-associated H-X9-DG protein
VAILASLLLGAVAHAKARAHTVQCIGNLRQIVLGFHMAVDDDGGKLGSDYPAGLLIDSVPAPQTSQNAWWDQNWGIPAKGSICPNAPDRSGRRTTNLLSEIPGTVRTAWLAMNSVDLGLEGFVGQHLEFRGSSGPRIGSYGPNNWVTGGSRDRTGAIAGTFRRDSEVEHPVRTPLAGDAVVSGRFAQSTRVAGPRATDPPPANLVSGDVPNPLTGSPHYGMATFAVPRHGSAPSSIPTRHTPSEKLPGAINMAYYDGHVEMTNLERLWSLIWHKEYAPPSARPGLP